MTELNIVPRGALLIRNGIVVDVGPASRVENLAGARHAREIDATGRVVMPAFVDADVALVGPNSAGSAGARSSSPDAPAEDGGDGAFLRLMSRQRVLTRAAAMSAECARYGCVTIGANTLCARDLKNIGKLLRVHQTLQLKPTRIRSIFSPQLSPDGTTGTKTPAQMLESLTSKWLPAVKSRKLASVVDLTVAELTVPDLPPGTDISVLRAAAVVAAGLGYTIRLRSPCRLEPAHLQLALAAGAMAIVAPMDSLRAFIGPLSAVGCIRVIPASEGFQNADADNAARAIRSAIDEGAAIALTSSYRLLGPSSLNMQYLLHLAVHKLGFTPEEAITATTWNPACSLRLSHVTGSLEPGKWADLIVMEVPDYRELARRAGHHDVSLVMRAGQIVLRTPALSVD
jgi:imidazolonepropionase